MSTFLLRVAIPVPVRQTFEYLPAAAQPDQNLYQPGIRCLVPFGNRTLVGVVVERAKCKDQQNLKKIEQLLESTPSLEIELFSLIRWIADYYHAPLGELCQNTLTPVLRKAVYTQELLQAIGRPIWIPTSESNTAKLRGERQKSLVRLLCENPQGLHEKYLRSMGYTTKQLNRLSDLGLATKSKEFQTTSGDGSQFANTPSLSKPQLEIANALSSNLQSFETHLLYGVTGSGKTEIYLYWISAVLNVEQTSQVLVMVPEIALTPQTIRRFQAQFGDSVSAYHSGMTDKERWRTWVDAKFGHTRIVIGTRSAVLLPFKRLSAIIVDEEHDSSFKQQDGARYHGRDLAILRASQAKCPVILGSATPSFESLFNAETKRYNYHRLVVRHNADQLPKVHLIDTKARPLEGGLSSPAVAIIKNAIKNNQQAMVFINRRGYAPALVCPNCGWLAECHSCDVRLTIHWQRQLLSCHHCERSYPLPTACPKCKSDTLQAIGTGTERTETVLANLFPDVPVLRIDRDVAQSKKEFNKRLEQIRSGTPCVIVGTQMLAKGHDFSKLSTIVVLNADSGLFSSDFRAPEKTAQMLIQVAGRAGRREGQGDVHIQTQFPDHPLLQAIVRHDYDAIYKAEMQQRQTAGLPPYQALAIIRAEAQNPDAALQGLQRFKTEMLQPHQSDCRILGPFPATIARKQNRYHAQLWLIGSSKKRLNKHIANWLNNQKPPNNSRRFRWTIDVDPVDTG